MISITDEDIQELQQRVLQQKIEEPSTYEDEDNEY